MTAADRLPCPLHAVTGERLDAWRRTLPSAQAAWVEANHFQAAPGSVLPLPNADGGITAAAIGIADPHDPFAWAHAPLSLPPGEWTAAPELDANALRALQLGWGLGAYQFGRYRKPAREPARLRLPRPDAETADVLAACLRARDLINTPTQDMGPQQLQDAVQALADDHDAQTRACVGDALLAERFPAIHAVGRASHRPPRLLELRWGEPTHPRLTLVGKGVCFDTGGLDIKPAEGMRNMKKDMGGAAHALALAGLVMARRLPVRLTLLIPAVENAIGPDAYRPGEVIATRSGVSVEIDNTDAEGRVILGDALAYACEDAPDLLLDFATLTGAARIALGPDLPALYSNDDALAADWLAAGEREYDPLWRMPLWPAYRRYLSSTIADIANGGPSKMAGSVTAALYLQRFVAADCRWAHLDVYGWNDVDRPGRPAGGEAQALRAAYAMLKRRYPPAA